MSRRIGASAGTRWRHRATCPHGALARSLGAAAILVQWLPATCPTVRAQSPATLSSFAIMACDPTTGQVGVGVASSGFSAGSGLAQAEAGAGAVAVLGDVDGAALRSVMSNLRAGTGAEAAVAAGVSGPTASALQIGVLTPACVTASHSSSDHYPAADVRSGRAGQMCYLALGSLLPDSRVVTALARGFESASGSLADRILGALQAARASEGELPGNQSAVLWISAPDAASGAYGRAELRLQVDHQQDPLATLTQLAGRAQADQLAGQSDLEIAAGDYQQAASDAGRATELDPESTAAWLNLGRALLYQGRQNDAEAAFRHMLELNPFLIRVLGDPVSHQPRTGVIPFAPRLLQRLDAYRRAFFPDADF